MGGPPNFRGAASRRLAGYTPWGTGSLAAGNPALDRVHAETGVHCPAGQRSARHLRKRRIHEYPHARIA